MRAPAFSVEYRPVFPAASSVAIFEPRYLDMVKSVHAKPARFGVCMIIQGEEVGQNTGIGSLVCEARIIDFDQTPDGLLGITAVGERRFHANK